MRTTVERFANSQGWSVAVDVITWRGPVDPDEPDALVSVSVDASDPGFAALEAALGTGDPAQGSLAVTAIAMPLSMLDSLARSCVERAQAACLQSATGAGAPDVRWMRALSRALQERGFSPRNHLATVQRVVDPGEGLAARALRVLGDGTLVTLSCSTGYAPNPVRAQLAFGESSQRNSVTLEAEGGTLWSLPRVAVGPSDVVWLAHARHDHRATLRSYRADGSLIDVVDTEATSPVQFVSVIDGQRWLHCDRHHVRCASADKAALVLDHSDWSQRPVIVEQRWLLTFSPRVFDKAQSAWVSPLLRWVDLAGTSDTVELPWNRPINDIIVARDRAWIATNQGVFEARAASEPSVIFERGAAFGLSAHGARIAFAARCEGFIFDVDSMQLSSAIELPSQPYRTWLSEGCLVCTNFTRGFVVDRSGAVVFDSGERREPAAVLLADGSAVVSAGEWVGAFDTRGQLVGTSSLPYDGQLVGATDTHAIFGPVSGGIARTEPTGLYAIDARGRCADAVVFSDTLHVQRPLRTRYAGGAERDEGSIQADRVLLIDKAGAVCQWTPRDIGSIETLLAPSKRAPVARNEVIVQAQTINPRDDFPVAGIEATAVTFLAVDGLYRGSTGVFTERAVVARNGAIVTLVRCKIDGDGGGATVTQGSTLALYDCTVNPTQITVEPGSHVLVFNSAS